MTDPRFSIIPAAAVTDPRLEGRDLQVLCLFGRHIDTNGWCRRSQVKMAKELNCARSTVQASIDRLVASGWLQKRSDVEPQTPGERTAAFEYRVMLDIPDVVGTPADLSAPPADVSENDVLKGPENMDRHPPAPPAALGNTGASGVRKAFSSAPMLTTPSNEKKEARPRLGPTEGLAVEASPPKPMLAIDRSFEPDLWLECERLMGKKAATSNLRWSFPGEIVDQARENLRPKAAA